MTNQASIHRLSISTNKGQKKTNVPSVLIDRGRGIIGDVHGSTTRQISLLPFESFSKLYHPDLILQPGDFAENITTTGLDFSFIKVGTILNLGQSAKLEIIQIGKECHDGCAIKEKTGDCIMPKEGVFAKVLSPGFVHIGDKILIDSP